MTQSRKVGAAIANVHNRHTRYAKKRVTQAGPARGSDAGRFGSDEEVRVWAENVVWFPVREDDERRAA